MAMPNHTISATAFKFEASEHCDGASVRNRGDHVGWCSHHRRSTSLASVSVAVAEVKVMFDHRADIASKPDTFFASRRPLSFRNLRSPAPGPVIEARVFATCDESVFGRCACVMSAHSHPYEATRSSLAQKPVWAVTIADARLNEGRLYRIVDLLMKSLTSIGRVIDNADSLETANNPHSCSALAIRDAVRSIRRDAHTVAEMAVHHGVRAIAASWPEVPAGPRLPDIKRLFGSRAPMPVATCQNMDPVAAEVDRAPVSAVTFAGGKVAVAMVDANTALRVMEMGDELDFIDRQDDDEWAAHVEETELSRACSKAGLTATGARMQILVAQHTHALSDDTCSRVILQDSGDGENPKILVAGVSVAHIATMAHLIYDRLSGGDSGLDFHSTPDWIVTIPTEETVFELETFRRERHRASLTIARAIERKVCELKAYLWRPGGPLVQRTVQQQGAWRCTNNPNAHIAEVVVETGERANSAGESE